jgi:hypothetical protein
MPNLLSQECTRSADMSEFADCPCYKCQLENADRVIQAYVALICEQAEEIRALREALAKAT